MNEKEKEAQKIWSQEVVRDFIRRMLLYYDPMNLFVFGVPDDEYDSYIDKVLEFLLEKIDKDTLEKNF